MRQVSGLFVAISIFAFADAGWASGDALSQAYQNISKDVAAKTAILQPSAAANGTTYQAPAVADYCVVFHDTGAEGMPDFFKFSCTNGVEIPMVRRWCWRSKCLDSFAAETKEMMVAKGYAEAAAFYFNGRREAWNTSWVFQKASAAPIADARYCLAFRQGSSRSTQTDYRIDCSDGAVTDFEADEPNNGTAKIAQYMAEKNYEQVGGSFQVSRDGSSPVLFRRKPLP